MTGIQPIHALRSATGMPGRLLEAYRKNRMAGADERERLVLEERRLAREAKKLERVLNKKGLAAKAPEEAAFAEELPLRPAPKVIDYATALPKKITEKKLVPPEPLNLENYVLPGFDLLDEASTDARDVLTPRS